MAAGNQGDGYHSAVHGTPHQFWSNKGHVSALLGRVGER